MSTVVVPSLGDLGDPAVIQAIKNDLDAIEDITDPLSVAWVDYTPAWTAASVNPAIGNGTIVGSYLEVGKLMVAHARILMGSTTTFGTGVYAVSVPFASRNHANHIWHGAGYARDTSAAASGHFPLLAELDNNDTTVSPINVNAVISPTFPFTWANTDHLSLTIVYEPA